MAVTVYVVPDPVTDAMEVLARPDATREKSLVSTPVTDSLKTTVQLTVAAFVGEVAARLIDVTVGAVVSSVKFQVVPVVVIPPFTESTRHVCAALVIAVCVQLALETVAFRVLST